MEIVALLFLAVLVAGYFVLAGCDVGLGMLMPYVARTPAERGRVVASVAPYFLGTEVWLVGTVGMTAGLFPRLEHEVVADLGPVLLVLLAGWVCRDAGLWFRARVGSRAWRGVWDAAITAGSWVLALAWGLLLGGLLAGGRPLSVFAVVCALAVAALFALRGAAFGAERLVPSGDPVPRGVDAPVGADTADSADVSARLTRALARVALGVLAVAAVVAVALPDALAADRPLAAGAVALLLVLALVPTAGLSGPLLSRHTSAVAIALAPLLVAVALDLPFTAAPPGTLALVVFAVAPVIPVMLVGQVWLYRITRRPATATSFFG